MQFNINILYFFLDVCIVVPRVFALVSFSKIRDFCPKARS